MVDDYLGMKQAGVAGESIQVHFPDIQNWVQAASVVDASIAQQATGAEQVSLAMRNIEEAMHQVLEGITHLETAAHQLEELSRSITELLSCYRL